MKKIRILTILLVVTLVAGASIFYACEKENTILNDIPPTQISEKIAIAKLTKNNKIVHLFLQKDVQEFFSKENFDLHGISSKSTSDAELVFIEVIDNEKNGKEVGLLTRIYYGESNIIETTIISSVLTLEGDVYYYAPPRDGNDSKATDATSKTIVGGTASAVSCTTSDPKCVSDRNGCQPRILLGTCTACTNGGTCTRTTTSVSASTMQPLTNAIQYAVSVY